MSRYDAAVVLGAMVLPDGRPSAALARRVAAAVDLHRRGVAPLLVMSGGAVGHPAPEARVMADLAVAAGVPEAALVVEAESRNTWQNARQAAILAEARGWSRLLVVSDSFHLPRARDMFRRHGLHVDGHPVPRGASDGRLSWWVAHGREGLSWVKHLYLTLRPPAP